MNKVLKINAAVLENVNKPLVIRELRVPKLVSGQVLVKIYFSGVCRSQLMEVQGGRGLDPWLPHLLGHEGSGVVVEVGPDVQKVKVGDEVILGWIRGEGLDAPGAKYEFGGQIINSGPVTTFCNYSIVAENRVVKKPKDLAFDVAILFGCALPTGAGMVLNELNLFPSSQVVVLGLGGIGLSALMAFKATNTKKIVAIDISDEKLELAKQLGATCTINSSKEDVERSLSQLSDQGFDICVESAGSVKTIELGFRIIRKNGGQLLFASHPPLGEKIRIEPHELICGKRITGSWGGASIPDIDIPKIYRLFTDSKTPLESLITKRYSLDQINVALDDLSAGAVFRPLIVMEH